MNVPEGYIWDGQRFSKQEGSTGGAAVRTRRKSPVLCVRCSTVIEVGDQYVLDTNNRAFCLRCAAQE